MKIKDLVIIYFVAKTHLLVLVLVMLELLKNDKFFYLTKSIPTLIKGTEIVLYVFIVVCLFRVTQLIYDLLKDYKNWKNEIKNRKRTGRL